MSLLKIEFRHLQAKNTTPFLKKALNSERHFHIK